MRLVELLTALDEARFEALCRRHGVRIDASKRLAPVEQAARALASPATLRQFVSWPESARMTASLLAQRHDGVRRAELGGGALPLVEGGLAFTHPEDPERVVMPSCYRVQIPASAADHPRAARLLLADADDDTLHAIASHHLGGRASAPRARVAGELLELLDSEPAVEALLEGLPSKERQLLQAIEARGGELETQELLALEKQPARYAGAQLPRRSSSWELVRRGLLLPVAHGLWAIPAEVAEVVGRHRRTAARQVRERVVRQVASIDRTPMRAHLAEDPGPAAVAVLGALRARGAVLRPGAGAPRTAVRNAARDAGVDAARATLWVSLARAAHVPSSRISVAAAGPRLFRVWCRSGAWDEAREPADRHRAGERLGRAPTPTVTIRQALLDVLAALPAGRFAPVADVVQAALADLRLGSASRLLSRARAQFPDAFEREPPQIVERIVHESLPALGVLDRGREEGQSVVRLSQRGRRWIEHAAAGEPPAETDSGSPVEQPDGVEQQSAWVGRARLRVGGAARVGAVIDVAEAAGVFVAEGAVYLEITEAAVRRATDRGVSIDDVESRLSALAGLDEATQRIVAEVRRRRFRAEVVSASAFVRMPDEMREALLGDAEARELLVASSPPGGVLVRSGVSRPKLRRLLRRFGAEIDVSEPD